VSEVCADRMGSPSQSIGWNGWMVGGVFTLGKLTR
jgi:hypothetical protein